MPDSSTPLARLKRRLDRLERVRKPVHGVFSLGHDDLDTRLGGGLRMGTLHEICAGQEDHAAASSFALMLAARVSGSKPILWVREDKAARLHGDFYGPGLVEFGIDPQRLILVQAPDTIAALRAAADSIGCTGLAAAVIEPFGAARALDLTASRKLILAAERSGVPAFILRASETAFASAASTRWQVVSAASRLLAGDAPGQPALAVDLIRHRGGVVPFSCILEWNRETRSFAPLSGLVPADAQQRSLAA